MKFGCLLQSAGRHIVQSNPKSSVYTDEMYLTFAIPDWPTINYEPYELHCNIDESRNCKLLMKDHKTNKESIDLLLQSAKVFTAEGMSGVKILMAKAAVMSSTQKFGSDGLWYRDTASYIQSRSQYDLEQVQDE
jgi:hypothetical protein